ncbi:sensor histidine kinase [Devosia honganensis]|uniref:histidine kinase n=1 Tax=Devosia honganensis TaxID=1610527 RepID=A0ABV7X3W5_9HYPH
MDERWNTLPNARRVLRHEDDPRPAWLWSQDGQRLIWSNEAAGLFLARIKKHGLKRAAPAVPIKGQVARIVRLGSAGRTSLARIRFLAGEKPVSATCATTPLAWENGEPALLIVGVDPVDEAIFAAARQQASRQTEAETAADEAPQAGQWQVPLAPPDNAYARELRDWQESDAETAYEPPVEPVEPEPDAPSRRLSDLVDRLAADEALYAPLTEKDDLAPSGPVEIENPAPLLYRITGSGFSPLAAAPETVAAAEPAAADQPDPETVERVSRYNFDELSRILTDRVGERGQPRPPAETAAPAPPPAPAGSGSGSGALINLGGETLVLNRLPLGILVFRDQQILFANRAITEMVGYDSVENLRLAGLAAVFPAIGGEGQEAGPVNHLVQRDGTLVPVTARLQSISWQGRPALMLSASTTEVRTGHEEAVRAFARGFAELRGDGFFETNRAGVVGEASPAATALLQEGKPLAGRPLSSLVREDDGPPLRSFLERPARFAETARPCLSLRSADGRSDISLFALGQAGVISGYFGLVRARAPARLAAPADIDPALLARIGRGIRRPLNTIVGFSDLIRSQAFGALGNERYEGYAEDISRAGQEIAALVDELEDYARLRDGRYLPQRASLDLTSLLESCVVRIRDQANAARVIVRNAISQTLPRVTADRASLAQAVLNLLASAIDQTPTGGAVVISAQRHEDGGIAILVRDGSAHAVDMAERFVVFRDGVDRSGQLLAPVRSSVGLALTRSLLAVNAVSLSVDPAGAEGMLFTLRIPPDLVEDEAAARDAE